MDAGREWGKRRARNGGAKEREGEQGGGEGRGSKRGGRGVEGG